MVLKENIFSYFFVFLAYKYFAFYSNHLGKWKVTKQEKCLNERLTRGRDSTNGWDDMDHHKPISLR